LSTHLAQGLVHKFHQLSKTKLGLSPPQSPLMHGSMDAHLCLSKQIMRCSAAERARGSIQQKGGYDQFGTGVLDYKAIPYLFTVHLNQTKTNEFPYRCNQVALHKLEPNTIICLVVCCISYVLTL